MIRAIIFSVAFTIIALPARASCAVADALIGQYGISFSGFTQTLPRVSLPAEQQSRPQALLTLALPNQNGQVSDGFSHTALINTAQKRVWILRTGGFAGVYQWYGPVALPAADFAGCKTEPGGMPQPVGRVG
ncbi:hypothetical protein [Collimonas sp.]|uniref:hypothetical protein n=1 Tax=Collimonas sp. TaxID=1963772 RepID=UPI002C29F8FB|nr:hypothetical protein [Collimonas sp.]HWX02094.1 hypothetical protein [Collimonas sp.]